jgi:hypothetical protein
MLKKLTGHLWRKYAKKSTGQALMLKILPGQQRKYAKKSMGH